MIKIIKNNLPIIILATIALFICVKNYTPGTFLSGWDTLHPEFNFWLNIKREISGVFRSYQGLGAVAAHSDMADLPRIIFLAVLDLFLPMNFLRYSYIFLTLILGPIGMYFFLKYIFVISNGVRNPIEISRHFVPRDDRNIPAFLGALFYLLNLGTMQQFVVPFEMFTTQYAVLPWLFLFATQYIYNTTHQKITLPLFAIVTLFSAPMAYAASLWYIYFVAFAMYLVSLSLSPIILHSGLSRISYRRWRFWMRPAMSGAYQNDGATKQNLVKKGFTLILLILLLNSFWILPNIYFVFNHASEVTQANINQMFSPQAFLYNKELGNIKDISLLKTFLFDWNVYAGNNHFAQLLAPWIQHLKQPFVESLGYLFAFVSLCGIIYSIFKRNKILIGLLPLLFLCLFFLFNDNFPTSPLYSFLEQRIPIFKEAFRFPQDKVLGIFTFLFAIYFAAGQLFISRLIRHSGLSRISHSGWRFWSRFAPQNDGKWVTATMKQFNNLTIQQSNNEISRPDRTISKTELTQILIVTLLIFYFMLPAFKGQLISPYMRIKIPEFYFEMFSFFNKEPQDGRIANLPIHSLWGWEYHEWYDNNLPSFQGAGFIWFGIKQPVLARDFDRWSPYNEQYYREMSYAIYSQNEDALKIVLEKYNIKYAIFDKSIIAPQNNSKVLLNHETQELLEREGYIQKVKEFGNTLIVYEVKSKTPNHAYLVQNPTYVYPESQVFYEDIAYKDYGTYIVERGGIYYPLANLIDNQSRVLPNTLKITQEGVVIKLPKDNPSDRQPYTLPSYMDTEESIASDLLVEKNQQLLKISLYPRFPIYNIKDHPIPIVVDTPMPKNENIILSINKKDNFILNLNSDTPLSLGTVFLKTKEDNTIAIYPSIPNEKITPDLSTIKYYVEPCEGTDAQKIFGIEKIQNNSFYIFGKNISLCMTIPLSEIILKNLKTSEALLNVTFNYKSNLPLKFCIAKLINAACQNYRDNHVSGQYFGFENKDLKDLGIQFQLDTTNSKSLEKAFYSNLYLSLTYPFFSTALSNDALKRSMQTIPQTLLKPSTLILPFSGKEELSANITKLPRTSGYCSNYFLSNPPLIKKEILKDSDDDFIRYTSQEGTACDHFSYQNLSQNEAYLVAITSRHIKGLPSTLCITNAVSRHCDIYTTLSSHKDFNTDIFLLPPYIENENGFDVNIGNLGIKKSPSINDLKSIEIIPIPYKWLAQIRHSGKPRQTRRHPESPTVQRDSGQARLAGALASRRSSGSAKRARMTGFEINSSILVLPQSFERGWKAYEIKVKSFFISFLPFLFGKELKDHVLVNNWANGWTIDNSKFNPSTTLRAGVQSSEFAVVFLPQYLEYLGFVLLLGTGIYLIKTYSGL